MATGIFNSTERSMRSVFVGNIPYDATEEKLKDIFSEVGPVLSFRLVYDRETGKPKGYGFCEYKDQETAMSAMRNLSGYELNGRTLRVDNAANERAREEIRNLQLSLGGSFESPYGPEIDPEKVPETISKTVASLPPEQMFELAKEMKQCIQTNPNEARNMLLQNPQLSYALLQALVVMRIVDPQIATSILHRQQAVPNLQPQEPQPQPQVIPSQATTINQIGFGVNTIPTTNQFNQFTAGQPGTAAGQGLLGLPQSVSLLQQGFDSRVIDPRLRDSAIGQFGQTIPASQNVDPRTRNAPSDPRLAQQLLRAGNGPQGPGARPAAAAAAVAAAGAQGIPTINQEQEKAQLIMQVLALSDQQIAMLPPEQRQSIMLLKEQISRGTQ